MPARSTIVAEARSWIGTRYRHQQSLKQVGCDCLGLLRGVWRAVYGAEPEAVPAYTSDWAEGSGEETLLRAAQRHLVEVPTPFLAMPGDVLLFRWKPHLPAKHCALLVAERRIVHAYDAAGRVAETSVSREWENQIAGVFSFPGVV